MKNNKKVAVGYTKKPFGVNGELRLSIEPEYLEDVMQVKVLFLEVKGNPVPYFVEEMRFSGTLIVKFEDVNSKEEARALSSAQMWIFEKDVLPVSEKILEVETLVFEKYIGYKIIDEAMGEIGKIERIEEFPQQEMAIVMFQEKEIMIPMNEQLISQIDENQKRIKVTLPAGLLEL